MDLLVNGALTHPNKCVHLVTEKADFIKYVCGKYNNVNLQTITEEVSVACLSDNDHMTEYTKKNVYTYVKMAGP